MSNEIESVEFSVEQRCQEVTCLCSGRSYSDPHAPRHTAVSRDMSDVRGDWVQDGRRGRLAATSGDWKKGKRMRI